MAESNEVQAIEKISSVVGESQVKIIFSNQCIKAQTFLVNRLKRQFERQKEISKFISTDNLKLETEIKNAEQEIKSLMLAHETIKSANVELKKEWQLAKERTQETLERVQSGEKRYEELWEQCKNRYQSINFVQNWLQAKKKSEGLNENINILDNEAQELLNEIKTKEDIISALNKKRIIELAEYLIQQKPKILENIRRTANEINELNETFEQLKNSQKPDDCNTKVTPDILDVNREAKTPQKLCNVKIDNDWPNLNKYTTNDSTDTLMPKLQLMTIDLDTLSVKLDQIKKCDVVVSPIKEIIPAKVDITETGSFFAVNKKCNEYTSQHFSKTITEPEAADEIKESKCNNYSKRKLINILEDIKLDKTEVYNLVTKVNIENLHGVDVIAINENNKKAEEYVRLDREKEKKGTQDVEMEEINITSTNPENILVPPSGFLDQLQNSQEKKKKVSFELPVMMHEVVVESNKEIVKDVDEENVGSGTVNDSPLEVSTVSDESFTKIKDLILKKHNLDLSPPFIYARNTVLQKPEETVRSNYFKLSGDGEQASISRDNSENANVKIAEIIEVDVNEVNKLTDANSNESEDKSVEMEVGEERISTGKVNEEQFEKPVTGLLFSHGPQGIPDSLDVSISTTGFEDTDADFPQYSSLLLSPKADLPMPSTSEKPEVISQEVPNFLSGFRKTGFSFFGKMPTADVNNTDSGTQSGGNNFNFAFGTDDKKNRGGIFNMFN